MLRDASIGKLAVSEKRRLAEVARIKGLLIEAKLTLTQIDRDYSLPAGTAGNTIHEPHLAGERAIAAALHTRSHLLWRTRYFSDGRRMSPQPAENYRHARRLASDSQEAA